MWRIEGPYKAPIPVLEGWISAQILAILSRAFEVFKCLHLKAWSQATTNLLYTLLNSLFTNRPVIRGLGLLNLKKNT